MKTLICGADVLVKNDEWKVLKNAYVGINDQVIDYVDTKRPSSIYDLEKSLSGKLLIPGLFNCHTHTSMGLLRGLGSDLPLHRWLTEAMFPIEDKLIESDINVGTRLAMLEMLASGTVSFSDMYYMTSITAEEVIKAGMKANLNRPLQGFDPKESYADNFRAKQSMEFFKNYNNAGDGRIIADFSIHAEYTSYDEIVKPYAEDCKSVGARMHIHLSETKKEVDECIGRHGKTPAQWFKDLGVFDNPTIAAHCVWLNDDDIKILKEKNVSVIHNPTSNLKLGSGFAPIQKYFNSKINVALGTDGAASNNNLNLFEEMHLAAIMHKGFTGDPTIVNPGQVLSMASVNGAMAQGRKDCGNIVVGNKADIVAIDLDKPHLIPNNDTLALLVYSTQASDVVMTMVDGKILYENGEYLTIDAEKTKAEAKKSIERLLK